MADTDTETMATFGASEWACYEYPGEDQQPLRVAFCAGAGWAAAELERLKSICAAVASGLRGQHATRDDMAKLADSAVHINT